MKKPSPKLILCILLSLLVILALAGKIILSYNHQTTQTAEISPLSQTQPTPSPTISKSLTPTPTASPSPTVTVQLTAAELSAKYGPCVTTPTIMYHHIQPEDIAKQKGQTGLTVTPTALESHINYLKQHGYNIVSIQNLLDFFNNGAKLPSKPVLLTFDDGYQDFYTYAFPILKTNNASATLFVPTGLMENPDYLTWSEILEMSRSGLVYMGNHTWSHHSTATNLATVSKEISTANQQLSDRGLDPLKIFAYPYGSDSAVAEKYLTENNFQIAFTTRPGKLLCKGQRLSLPRVRAGNASLSAYGF